MNDVVHKMKLVRRDYVRRQDVHDVAQGPQEHAAAQKILVKFGPQRRQVAGIRNIEFDGGDGSDMPDVGDARLRSESWKPLFMYFFDFRDSLKDRLVLKNLQRRIGGRARNRIRRVGVTVEKSAHAISAHECVMNAIRGEGSGERQKS